MISITFNNFSLQSSSVITSEIQHENVVQKRLNIQKFAEKEGGAFIRPDFDIKIITLKGIIKGTSQSDLETNIDSFKKNINSSQKNLDIEYLSGTRRYIATCSKMLFEREHYSIDVISWELEFMVCNPALGTNIDTSTLEALSNANTFAGTLTGEHDGYLDFSGTFRPNPIIKLTFNSCNGIQKLQFRNTNGDGLFSLIEIKNYKFENGDIILIDTGEGTVTVNGEEIEFSTGFPNFTVNNNTYTLRIVGISYNADLKVIYYPLWL